MGKSTTRAGSRARGRGRGGAVLGSASSRDVLTPHLVAQVDSLRGQAPGVRDEDAASVHRMRTASRQLRSALTTYEPLFQPGSLDGLRGDLRWLSGELAGARDAHVFADRLEAALALQPTDLVFDDVSAWVRIELGKDTCDAHERVRAALASSRYDGLLERLDGVGAEWPWAPLAEEPAREVLASLVSADVRRLGRAVRAVEAAPLSDRDAALHEVRKRAKRVRYAASSSEPALGRRARQLARKAAGLQDGLGDHHDAVVAREYLLRVALNPQGQGLGSFTIGRMHALEEQRARDAEERFWRAWADLPRRRVKSWLLG